MTENHEPDREQVEAFPSEAVTGRVIDAATGRPYDEPAPVQEWNPLRRAEPETIPLKVSGGEASLTYRRWSGRERLAYEDALTERFLTTDERDGTDTVKLGSMRLYAVSLTIVGSSGFERFAGPDFLQGDRAKIERDLLMIDDEDTYAEIMETALRVQPLPRQDKADEETGGDDATEDPSRTLSTPQIPVDKNPA